MDNEKKMDYKVCPYCKSEMRLRFLYDHAEEIGYDKRYTRIIRRAGTSAIGPDILFECPNCFARSPFVALRTFDIDVSSIEKEMNRVCLPDPFEEEDTINSMFVNRKEPENDED